MSETVFIPVPYYDYDTPGRPEKWVNIPGALLIWEEDMFRLLCCRDLTQLGKGQKLQDALPRSVDAALAAAKFADGNGNFRIRG